MADRTPLNEGQDQRPDNALDPAERLLQQHTVALVRGALEQLPVDFREVIALREIESLSTRRLRRSLACRSARSCRDSPEHASGWRRC